MYSLEIVTLTTEQMMMTYGFWKLMSYLWTPVAVYVIALMLLFKCCKEVELVE